MFNLVHLYGNNPCGVQGITTNCASRISKLLILIRIPHFPLDGFPFPPIIGRNHKPMNQTLFSLSLIVVVLAVLIIKDQFSVRMATVRVK